MLTSENLRFILIWNEIYAQFKKLLYSRSEDVFDKENAVFMNIIEGVEVRTGDEYVQLTNYYVKNWEKSKALPPYGGTDLLSSRLWMIFGPVLSS